MGSEIVESERCYGDALASTAGDSIHEQVMRDAAASILRLCDHATALEAMCEKMAGALLPFAGVADAFDYWDQSAMPEFNWPRPGTNQLGAVDDCPNAVGQLYEGHFTRARETLAQYREADNGR